MTCGARPGSLDTRISMNSRPSMARENTTRHTVSGIASASPIHPQSQVQNAAAIRRAIDETPALRAKNRGSRTNTTRASETAKRSEEHTSELQSHHDLVCRLLLEKK